MGGAGPSLSCFRQIWIYSGKHTGDDDNWGGDLWRMTAQRTVGWRGCWIDSLLQNGKNPDCGEQGSTPSRSNPRVVLVVREDVELFLPTLSGPWWQLLLRHSRRACLASPTGLAASSSSRLGRCSPPEVVRTVTAGRAIRVVHSLRGRGRHFERELRSRVAD